MNLLLDTHILLWAIGEPDRLSSATAALLRNSQNRLVCSAASIWESSIKFAAGKLTLPLPPDALWPQYLAAMNIDFLPVKLTHTLLIHTLPPHHRDPFDRMLIAQAISESLTIVTADDAFAAYPVKIINS